MGIQEEEIRTTTYCLFCNLCFNYYIFSFICMCAFVRDREKENP